MLSSGEHEKFYNLGARAGLVLDGRMGFWHGSGLLEVPLPYALSLSDEIVTVCAINTKAVSKVRSPGLKCFKRTLDTD